MYSIDINLLRERAEFQTGAQTDFVGNTTLAPSKYSKVPMYIGIGAAVLALLSAGGGWFWLGQQTTQLEAKQKELDLKLGSLKAQDARLVELNGQVAQVTDEAQSFASVFNQVQPWSAVLQDLRESIPQGVQIFNVSQSEVKFTPSAVAAPAPAPAPAASGGLVKKISTVPDPEAKPGASPAPSTAPSPAASPAATAGGVTTYPTLEDSINARMPKSGSTPAPAPIVPAAPLAADVPTTKLDITGTAKSFDEVNNFILTLKQSAFFNPDETQLVNAGLMAATPVTKATVPVDPNQVPSTTSTVVVKPKKLELPPLVEYKIQTSLKRIPAADLIRELERKGAVGLVARLKSLQQQQVIKP
jgi:type IV pilus assembly protein PilN